MNLDKQIAKFHQALFRPPIASRYDPSRTAVRDRVRRSLDDFWAFDEIYFPPEVYAQGYAQPGDFHREIVEIDDAPGMHLVLGPRKHGKTVTLKKKAAWRLLTGRTEVMGTLSHVLDTSRNLLDDILSIIIDNPAIIADWNVQLLEDNEDQFKLMIQALDRPVHTVWCRAFSENRSVRSFSRMFSRPDYIYGDDIETKESPMNPDQVRGRLSVIAEAKSSLADGGTMTVAGNNLDERSMANTLVEEGRLNQLPKGWTVHVFDVWRDGRPLWPERFPAKTIEQLREMLEPADESEWSADYRQEPTPPDGFIFLREYYAEWNALPDDLRGVIFCDPNLSKKGKGDSTAVTAMGYSSRHDLFYVARARCRSYGDSNHLLDDVLEVYEALPGMRTLAFDGNVSQESTWTNNVRNWCRIQRMPYPRIHYRRYRVDDLCKNLQAIWNERRILFPPGFGATTEGKRYLAQLYAFSGKGAAKKDDAPDSLISAGELLYERKIVRRSRTKALRVQAACDHYTF